MNVLVTGSSGLIGSEVVNHFDRLDCATIGVDNNQRRAFFGPEGDTTWNRERLERTCRRFTHHELDVRDRAGLAELIRRCRPGVVVHAAAQPSHDLAATIPFDDFEVNAVGTLNLLEAVRAHAADALVVFLSTNKVYGDRPNAIPVKELPTRLEFDHPAFADGVDEDLSIDQSKHSLFGASKAAADLLVQEYGRYFGLRTVALRGGCLTGPAHSGVELHGFLSYLVRCNLERREYRVYGHGGKQVRDNVHAVDVARCIEALVERPPAPGSVFNLGGGKANAISILEAFDRVALATGIPMRYRLEDRPRDGDHRCYYSNLARLRAALPDWTVTRSLDDIFDELVAAWRSRLA